MISVCFQGKPFNITVIQVYAPTSNDEEAEVDPCPRGPACSLQGRPSATLPLVMSQGMLGHFREEP